VPTRRAAEPSSGPPPVSISEVTVAIPKICGIETEYGILVRGADPNPVAASSLLIESYVASTTGPIGWDFVDESPGRDARGFSLDEDGPEIETHLVNAVLSNGARYYVDHAHPEMSTPECRTALEALAHDLAAEEIVRRSMTAARRRLPDDAELIVYKNNSDGKGNSYGCHENYLVDRLVPFGRLVSDITPHFVTRQVFCGAGKVGAEAHGGEVDFQLSQRADFFEEEVGLETTLKRPIVNTRDEPHCDPAKYRRLHVIVGDANLSQTATFLKLASTAIVLAMIEDDFPMGDLVLAHPVPAIRQVSHDPTLRQSILLRDGRRLTALDLQWSLLEAAQKYAIERGLEPLGERSDGGSVGDLAIDTWEQVLGDLETGNAASTVDWAAKLRLVDGYAARHGLGPRDARLKAIDLQYHDLRPGRGLAERLGLTRLVDRDEVERAVTEPPESTRAWFRGTCLRRWPESVVAANWDSVVFDTGRDPLVRVPMPEPLRGTRDLVGPLFDRATSPADLIALLAGGEPRI